MKRAFLHICIMYKDQQKKRPKLLLVYFGTETKFFCTYFGFLCVRYASHWHLKKKYIYLPAILFDNCSIVPHCLSKELEKNYIFKSKLRKANVIDVVDKK